MIRYIFTLAVNEPKGKKIFFSIGLLLWLLAPAGLRGQNFETDSTGLQSLTLEDCINYALEHQPRVHQSNIDIAVARTTNAINIASFLPQVNAAAGYTQYGQLPTSYSSFSGTPTPIHTGITYQSTPQVTASETFFSPQLIYAVRSAPLYVRQTRQAKDSTHIWVIATVSKTFYNLLLTLQQIDVLKDDTARLDRNVSDTWHQYVAGIVDETDYEEAVISLNNTRAQLKQQMENIRPGYATLKQIMGFPPEKDFNVSYDTAQMIADIGFDTLESLDYSRRIQYRLLQTTKQLQHEVTGYYGVAFLPTVSIFYNYYLEFENPTFSQLYARSYPYNDYGISLSIPIFTGFSRLENIHKSRLLEQRINWDEVTLKAQIYTEYTTALANYKGNLYNWKLLKENVEKAKDVFRIVSLQYRQGIIPYLNVLVAENNLISAQIGYINALFQLLSSKIDLEKAMGDIPEK
jgi:outer membrane protein TolC